MSSNTEQLSEYEIGTIKKIRGLEDRYYADGLNKSPCVVAPQLTLSTTPEELDCMIDSRIEAFYKERNIAIADYEKSKTLREVMHMAIGMCVDAYLDGLREGETKNEHEG